jgi:hypothetical protein
MSSRRSGRGRGYTEGIATVAHTPQAQSAIAPMEPNRSVDSRNLLPTLALSTCNAFREVVSTDSFAWR